MDSFEDKELKKAEKDAEVLKEMAAPIVPFVGPQSKPTEIEKEIIRDQLVPSIISTTAIQNNESIGWKSGKVYKRKLLKPKGSRFTYEEIEQVAEQVAFGLTLEQACIRMTPPLKPDSVETLITHNRNFRLIYERAQANWIFEAMKRAVTWDPKDAAGIIFLLRNRHSKMFNAGKINVALTSAPLQLNSPDIIEKARLYAQKMNQVIDIDVEETPEQPKQPKQIENKPSNEPPNS